MGFGDRVLQHFGIRQEDGTLEIPKDIAVCPYCRKICKHELGICQKTYDENTDDFTGKGCGKDRYKIFPLPTESNVKEAWEIYAKALMDEEGFEDEK